MAFNPSMLNQQRPEAPQSRTLGVGAGTGFTNIDKYLGANQTAGYGVENAAQGAVAKQSADSARDLRSAENHLNSAGWHGTGDNVTFDPTASDAEKDLTALGSGATAGRVLAKNAGVTGQYDPRQAALDAGIYGANNFGVGNVAGMQNKLNQGISARVADINSRYAPKGSGPAPTTWNGTNDLPNITKAIAPPVTTPSSQATSIPPPPPDPDESKARRIADDVVNAGPAADQPQNLTQLLTSIFENKPAAKHQTSSTAAQRLRIFSQ